MEYLGSLGRLIPLRCASQERSQASSRYRESFTVEGRRRVQIVPDAPRTWDVSWDLAYPPELAALAGFTSGAWGHGPWHWVPITAQSGNLLTPREAQLVDRAGVSSASIQDAGPVRDSDGNWSPRSVTVSISSGWVALARDVPVIAGKPFTFSCDVQGGFTPGEIHVAFYDAAGGAMSGGAASAPNAGMHRVSYSGVVPAGAASARVGVRSGTKVATRPQATWTAGPVPFAPGAGCRSAVIEAGGEDVLALWKGVDYRSTGFTVLEVA